MICYVQEVLNAVSTQNTLCTMCGDVLNVQPVHHVQQSRCERDPQTAFASPDASSGDTHTVHEFAKPLPQSFGISTMHARGSVDGWVPKACRVAETVHIRIVLVKPTTVSAVVHIRN